MSEVLYEASGTSAATGAASVDLKISATHNQWPAKGRVGQIKFRLTTAAGGATKYSWGLYSVDPGAALPGTTELWEYLIVGGFDFSGSGGEDERAVPSGDTGIPDVFLVFEGNEGIWESENRSSRVDNLWFRFTFADGAANVVKAYIWAGPHRVVARGEETQLNAAATPT